MILKQTPFLPQFGGNIIRYLFENYDDSFEDDIREAIRISINTYEPRVVCYSVNVNFEEDTNQLDCSISYMILGIEPKVDNLDLVFKP